MRIWTLIVLPTLLAAPATAQNKYQKWSNPDEHSFADKLNALIDDAEKSRAADPSFLKDLRALAESASGKQAPASRQAFTKVFSDDFADGEFERNPAWTVSSGRYWVEAGWGLRSSVTAETATTEEQPRKMTKRDKAFAILGAVLNQAAGAKGGSAGTTAASAPPTAAAIHARTAVANAFKIEFSLSSWLPEGQFDLGPYQGTAQELGYRLRYQPGGALSLLRVSGSGSAVIARAAQPVALEDKKSHAVEWSRDAAGRMVVSIDGKQVIDASDTGFRDAFQGITIGNQGGDYIIKNITVFNAG